MVPNDDAEFEPFDCMVESVRTYKKVKYGEYVPEVLKMKLDGKAHSQLAKIEN